MPAETAAERKQGSRAPWLAVAAAAVLTVLVVGLGLGAASAYQASRQVGIPLDQRIAHARRAATLAPWSAEYRARLAFVETWKRGEVLLGRGDFRGSLLELRSIVGTTLAEPDLGALYRQAERDQIEGTNWKAHVQHAREGPGGTLRPEDVIR